MQLFVTDFGNISLKFDITKILYNPFSSKFEVLELLRLWKVHYDDTDDCPSVLVVILRWNNQLVKFQFLVNFFKYFYTLILSINNDARYN